MECFMRTFLTAAAAAMTLAVVSAAPASATHWECVGGPVACGDDGGSKNASKRASRKAAAKSGDQSDFAPKKSAYKAPKKAKQYASNDEDDEAPARRTKTVTYSGGGGSSSGMASYYWQPQKLASGGWFNPSAMTAAHKTLPFGTKVRVTNKHNGRSVVVTINDRGPYIAGRVIDLSKGAAGVIGMQGAGVVPVSLSVLGR